jgi:probable rRNA maturation factor
MPVAIQNRQRTVKIQTPLIKKRLQQLLVFVGCADAELSVVFANDTLMQALNRTYRHKDQTTNVLAFPQPPAEPGEADSALLGDVIVSLPAAAREARVLRQSLEDRVLYLLIHGILHLLGYDHEGSEDEGQRMAVREQEILAFLHAAERRQYGENTT